MPDNLFLTYQYDTRSGERLSEKIGWIDNLRAMACMMVVMIHATTYYVTNGAAIGLHNWDIANVLNSLSPLPDKPDGGPADVGRLGGEKRL